MESRFDFAHGHGAGGGVLLCVGVDRAVVVADPVRFQRVVAHVPVVRGDDVAGAGQPVAGL